MAGNGHRLGERVSATSVGNLSAVDPLGSLSEIVCGSVRGDVVFIDEPNIVRAIRALAPEAHVVILPGAHGRARRSAEHFNPRLATLTHRERAVLARVATGETNAEIADAMGLSPNTVKAYLHSVMRKLGARNRIEALACARTYGLV